MQGYERDPRSLGKRAEAYLKSTGIADGALFGPENEFFIFDSVRWNSGINEIVVHDRLRCRARGTATRFYPDGNKGHRPGVKGGYFPVPPVDAFQDIRSAMCDALEEMGLKVEVHHHEVATGGQCEIGVGPGGLVKKADEVQILKYAIHNVAHSYGKTRHVHAEAPGRRQRLGHARAPVAAEGRHRRCSPVTSTAVSPTPRCTTSAASSSTRRRSTRSRTRARTATSAWSPASKRR